MKLETSVTVLEISLASQTFLVQVYIRSYHLYCDLYMHVMHGTKWDQYAVTIYKLEMRWWAICQSKYISTLCSDTVGLYGYCINLWEEK